MIVHAVVHELVQEALSPLARQTEQSNGWFRKLTLEKGLLQLPLCSLFLRAVLVFTQVFKLHSSISFIDHLD